MAAIPKIDETHLESLCEVIGHTSDGLTGSEIGRLLTRLSIVDPLSGATKRIRLHAALSTQQSKDGCANIVFAFVETVLSPVRFRSDPTVFDELRARVNEVLAFCGYSVGEDGKLRIATKAQTLTEAQERAGRLRQRLMQRRVHHDVLRFCQAELVRENHFHAVFEATKSVAEKIRTLTNLTTDGADLIDTAFSLKNPLLALNTLETETERSEQSGFANLIKGIFGTFRNVTAHAPKITWPINEEDALDLLSIVSYVHRRLDNVAKVPPRRVV